MQQNPALGQLKPFTPVHYGTLVLQGEEDGAGGVRPLEDAGSEVSGSNWEGDRKRPLGCARRRPSFMRIST